MCYKKLSCLILLLIVVVSSMLVGCSNGDTKDDKLEDVTGSVSSPAGDTGASSTDPSDQKTDNPLSIGRIEGGVYSNSYIGIACNLDSSWSFYSAEELQELPDNVHDMFEGSDISEIISSHQQIIDMQAQNTETSASVNVVMTKLSTAERVHYELLSEEEIIDETLAQKDSMIDAYEQAGITVESMSKKTVTFLGQQRTAIYSVCNIQGIPYYMLQLLDFHLGSYGASITMACFDEADITDLLNLFYAV
ncbi:MAG: hypothetical protein IJV82_01665 [Oscillospiraceae bacterium]|nr:hypothetical protein [Oscillospiraceae bacterium]